MMLKNYLSVAFRNLRKRPGHALINIFGLATGLACCLLIVLFVRDELTYDRFHEKAERTYRIAQQSGELTPSVTVGVPVELPKTAANTLPTDPEEPLTVTLTADGQTMIQTSEVADEEIIPRLSAILTERTSDKVFLRADGAIPYARVVQVMGALNSAGITNIGLVTDSGGPRMTDG